MPHHNFFTQLKGLERQIVLQINNVQYVLVFLYMVHDEHVDKNGLVPEGPVHHSLVSLRLHHIEQDPGTHASVVFLDAYGHSGHDG